MGRIRTILIGLVLSAATSAGALPHSPSQQAQVFASCAGRLLALEEHQRLTDGPASEATAVLRNTFLDLLDAVLPDAYAYGMPPGYELQRRVMARAEQRSLLSQAAYATEMAARAPARAAADRHVAVCKALITGA